jgi:hypothetical protein
MLNWIFAPPGPPICALAVTKSRRGMKGGCEGWVLGGLSAGRAPWLDGAVVCPLAGAVVCALGAVVCPPGCVVAVLGGVVLWAAGGVVL